MKFSNVLFQRRSSLLSGWGEGRASFLPGKPIAMVSELKYDLRLGGGKNCIKATAHVSAVISRLLI